MRALFLDFPADAAAAPVDDQFMFGDELLVAPVLAMGQRTRTLYLPAGASWREHWTNITRAGGATITVDAPIEQIPFFHRVSGD
jgi:alpha-D-xyloside xylohydrolase